MEQDGAEACSGEVRGKMLDYWTKFEPSLASMMCSNDGSAAARQAEEIFDFLGNFSGKKVLEIGAGIGRMTSIFAEKASHVISVDFVDRFVEHNRKINGQYSNITFLCEDAMKLDYPAGSFDLVFSSSLLNYLNDTEVRALFRRFLSWLSPKGHLFFMESCYHQSGNLARKSNPTIYRTPSDYIAMLEESRSQEYEFSLLRMRNVFTFVRDGKPNLLKFLAQKVERGTKDETAHGGSAQPASTLQSDTVLKESIFKHVWSQLGEEMDVKRVLDVGCGSGESAIFLSHLYGFDVYGVDNDLSSITTAIGRQDQLKSEIVKKMQFEFYSHEQDNLDFRPDSYDIIYCRKPLNQVTITNDKVGLLGKFYTSLRQHGVLILGDFFDPTGTMDSSGQQGELRDYSQDSLADIQKLLEGVGFKTCTVVEEDIKDILGHMKKEIEAFSSKEPVLTDFAEQKTADLGSHHVPWTCVYGVKKGAC